MIDWVQLNKQNGVAIRIFRSKKAAAFSIVLNEACIVTEREHALAVGQIRRQVFTRDEFTCVKCGQELTWATAEMDERQARGRCEKVEGGYQSGEVSVENCQTYCRSCHTSGPNAKHKRAPSFSRGQ